MIIDQKKELVLYFKNGAAVYAESHFAEQVAKDLRSHGYVAGVIPNFELSPTIPGDLPRFLRRQA